MWGLRMAGAGIAAPLGALLPTGALRWPGGSPLRAAGGQPCWNAWPGQTRPLQSLQKTQPNPQKGFDFVFCYASLSGGSSARTTAPLARLSANYLISTLAPASSNFFLIASASALLVPSFTGFG